MNWFKKIISSVDFKIISYNYTYNQMTVSINGIIYRYSNISPYIAEKIKKVSKFAPGKAIQILRNFPFEKGL